MKKLILLSVWQVKLLAKYQILTVAFIIGLFYALAFKILPALQTEQIASFLIFSDPSMLGFIFVGAMILFEKTDGTLAAQTVTPMLPRHYLIAKALALLFPAVICSVIMVISAQGLEFRLLPFLLSTILSSLLFTFLGIAGAVRVDTLNQYIIVIPLFLLPTSLPLLNFFNLTHWKWLYVVPTQASLYLFQQSFDSSQILHELLAVLYLLVWVIIAFYIARKSYVKKLYQ